MQAAKSTYIHRYISNLNLFFLTIIKYKKDLYKAGVQYVSKSLQVSGSHDLLLKIVSIFCIVYPQLYDEKDESAFHIALSVPNPVILHSISRKDMIPLNTFLLALDLTINLVYLLG